MVVRRVCRSGSRVAVVGLVLMSLLVLAPGPGAEETYTSGLPQDVLSCAQALAWSSGYRHITHRDEQWSVAENAPREMCVECAAPMCVVCMEYDLGSYDDRPGVSAPLRGCQDRVESYLRGATRPETEVLAAAYWAAYWAGRHNDLAAAAAPELVVGQPGLDGAIEFPTPFILGVTALRVDEIAACTASTAFAPSDVTAEFVFAEPTKPFFEPQDLATVILTADGFAAEVFAEMAQTQGCASGASLAVLVPLAPSLCLEPLVEGACRYCTVKLEILSDNGTSVKARLIHCGENGRWEQWFRGDLPRRKTPPPAECKTCNYWLHYEQVSMLDQNRKPLVFGKYTLYHCNPDNVWSQVYVHTVDKMAALPKDGCVPGREAIVQKEVTRNKKVYVQHDLYRCTSAGQWVKIGSWTEPKP